MLKLKKYILLLCVFVLQNCIQNDERKWGVTEFGGISEIREIIWANNQFLAVGTDSYYDGKIWIFISANGVNWKANSPVVNLKKGGGWDIQWLNNRYLLEYRNVNDKKSYITSPDGVNWSQIVPNQILFGYIIYDEKSYFTSSGSCSNLLKSTDLVNWYVTPVNNNNLCIGPVLYSNGTYLGTGHYKNQTNGKLLFVSKDAINWKELVCFWGIDISDMIYAHGEFIATGYNGAIYTSPDGETWTNHSILFGPNFNRVTSDDFSYLFLPFGGAEIYTTKNFNNWAVYSIHQEHSGIFGTGWFDFTGYYSRLNDAATNGNVYVVVGGVFDKDPNTNGDIHNGVILTSQ